jgi:transcriptional regulator with GAF, ATPase, and Fis domain
MGDTPLQRTLREANAELLRRIEELSLVRLVGDALAGAVEAGAIATALVGLLRDELHVDLVGLWAVDELAAGLRPLAVANLEGAVVQVAGDAPVVPYSSGALGAAASGRTVHVADLTRVPGGAAPAETDGVRELLCHPIGARGRTLGVMVLGSVVAGGIDAEHERLLGLIAPAVAMALENAALYGLLAHENRALRAELGQHDAPAGLIGSSPPFRALLTVVERLADTDVTVLVLGASGTGKELVARALHQGSRRRERPFVAVNCAALPETLLESELFGIERGVATGVERRPGLVERADGGTLFLDEIGDMAPGVQAKILRVLQEREVTRVGAARPLPVDIRVVAATHRDLESGVREGRFREDLYFRLKVATVRVPSLAERREDVALLAQHFVARFAVRHGRGPLRLASDAMAALTARPWPGNVRELANVIEQAVVMGEGPVLHVSEVQIDVPSPEEHGLDYHRALDAAVGSAERALIERALASAGQNRTQAARLLGIGRRTLLYKLKRHRIDPRASSDPRASLGSGRK